MEEIIYLEVINPSGIVSQRFHLKKEQTSVGRSYTNDIILDDPSISPEHLLIEIGPENRKITDLKSENGLFLNKKGVRAETLSFDKEKTFQIGQTTLRVRTSSFNVSPTKLLHQEKNHWKNILSHPLFSLSTLGALLLIFIFTHYQQKYDYTSLTKLGTELTLGFIFLLFGLSFWAGIWALISRIVLHRSYFLAHLAIACLGGILFDLFSVGLNYFSFGFSLNGSYSALGYFGNAFLTGIGLYFHLNLCTKTVTKKLASIVSVTVIFLWGIMGTAAVLSGREFTPFPSFQGHLKPPMFRIVPPQPINTWLTGINVLKEKADKSFQKKK